MIGDALMLSPQDTLAIGLICLTAVQIAKLAGMPSEWAPPVAIILGGVVGIATGLSHALPWESWLSFWYDGAIGGLTGIGAYSAGSAMGATADKIRKDKAAKQRAEAKAESQPTPVVIVAEPPPRQEGIA